MGKNPFPTRIAGTRTFPVYPSPLPVGESDYLSCNASIRSKEVQHRYFGPNLNNHIYSLCVLGTLVQLFLTIFASSTSTPASRALVPLASSVRSLCHLCSSSSQPRSFSASPRLRHLYPGEEETSPIVKLRPQVSLFIGYAVPVGYLLLDRCPTDTGIGKNLYPRQLTKTGMG